MTEPRSTRRFPHRSILASAGSGKTFQLSSRYLALIDAGAPVATLLASTFTRAAAGEIRDRILMRLADAADDESKRALLAEALGRDACTRDEVLAILRTLAGNLHRMQIRTLDSLFASVVRAYAIELGVPANATIADEAEEIDLRLEAIRRVLDASDPRRLVDLLRRLTQGASDRSVMSVLDRTFASLYEVYREADPAAWDRLPRGETLDPATLAAAVETFADEAGRAPGSLLAAARKDLVHARAGDWEAFIGSGVPRVVARGDTTYRRAEIPADLAAATRTLLDHAAGVLLRRLREQNEATWTLLDRFHACASELRRERRVLTFADLTAVMADAQRLARAHEIYFRLDGAVDHLLLDEFQDTNVQQWRALAPMALEILHDASRPRTFFCVGDVKQSIYGWRDACPELLDGLPDLLTAPDGTGVIRRDAISTSYRSSPVVIDVVNRIFAGLPHNPALEKHPEAAALFASGFADHATTRTTLPGYAELRTVPRAEASGDQPVLRLRSAAALVTRLHERAPQLEIAMLVRTNAAVSRLLFELSRRGVPASGRGGGPLTDAPAVNAILDLITLADHPDDLVAGFNVARSPLGRVLEFTDETVAARRARVSQAARHQLVEQGYARTIAGWTAQVASDCDERELRRLHQLVELAGRRDTTPPRRPGEFVRFVERHRVAEIQPAPVQVMTVHQAKGLEFDIVILPELESPLSGVGSPPVVLERTGDMEQRITNVCRWVNRATRDLVPALEPPFARHETRTVRESLCLLYVAITRARQGLYMLIDPPAPRTRGGVSAHIPRTAAGVVRCALTDERPPEPDAVLFTRGDPAWITGPDETPASIGVSPRPPAGPGPPERVKLAPPGETPGRALAAPAASTLAAAKGGIAELLRLGGDESRERGSAIHALFQTITWLESWRSEPAELRRIVRRVAPRRGAAWHDEVVAGFLAMLETDGVRGLLSRGDRPEDRLRVWTERPFVRLVDSRVQQGSIDRLVAELDADGRPRHAQVVDLKTDAISGDEAAGHAERYRGQLETYRAVAMRSLGLEASAVEMTLLFVGPGLAATLSPVGRPAGDGQASFPWGSELKPGAR